MKLQICPSTTGNDIRPRRMKPSANYVLIFSRLAPMIDEVIGKEENFVAYAFLLDFIRSVDFSGSSSALSDFEHRFVLKWAKIKLLALAIGGIINEANLLLVRVAFCHRVSLFQKNTMNDNAE